MTKTITTRYKRVCKAEKGRILDELCATTGWHRNHARRALGQALRPKVVRTRRPRPPTFSVDVVVVALRFCWAVLGAPTGKRLAPVMGVGGTLRRFGELDVTGEVAASLVVMSAATMDRRLAPAQSRLVIKGRVHTKPGSLLKSRIPIRHRALRLHSHTHIAAPRWTARDRTHTIPQHPRFTGLAELVGLTRRCS